MIHARRGNYAMLFAVALAVLLGFGALAIDIAYQIMTKAQAQGVADAASQAAIIVLRQTGDQTQARRAAEHVVSLNAVAHGRATMTELTFGSWDDAEPDPVFRPTVVRPNAARVRVARAGDASVPYLLAPILGFESFDVNAMATSAARSTQVIIVLDVTGSWGERDFAEARAAVLTALDMLTLSASDVDEVGLTIFTNRYAWEYTPLTDIALPENAIAVQADWAKLNLASKGGTDLNPLDGLDCELKPMPQRDDFTNPAGGCYPNSPREYTDESGTDHSVGLQQARAMFEERPGGAAFRGLIVLTDGRPNRLEAEAGQIRQSQGYQETRWREHLGPVPRTEEQIRAASVAVTEDLWNELRVHTWVVSLVAHDAMMPMMAQGDGYYTRTDDPTRLAAIFAQIISEMPLAIVE